MTTTASLGSRDQRALLVGGIAILLLLGASRGAPALRQVEESNQREYEESRRRVVRERARLDRAASADSRAAEIAARDRVVSGASRGEAFATLSEYIGSLARFAGVEIQSFSPVVEPSRSISDRRFVATVSASADTRAFMVLLRELEVGNPVVVVKRLRVSQPDAAASADGGTRLRIELTVVAVGGFDTAGARR